MKKKKRPLIVPQKVETNTINSKLNTITAASIQQGREAVKSQKVNLAFQEFLAQVLEQKLTILNLFLRFKVKRYHHSLLHMIVLLEMSMPKRKLYQNLKAHNYAKF